MNRCLAEGRERFRHLLTRSEDGSRCAELRAAAVGLLRRRGERRGRGHRARAPAGLRSLPRDHARLPGDPGRGRRPGARPAGLPLACWNGRRSSSPDCTPASPVAAPATPASLRSPPRVEPGAPGWPPSPRRWRSAPARSVAPPPASRPEWRRRPSDSNRRHTTAAKIERVSERALEEAAPPAVDYEPAPPPPKPQPQPAPQPQRRNPNPNRRHRRRKRAEAGAVEYTPPPEPAAGSAGGRTVQLVQRQRRRGVRSVRTSERQACAPWRPSVSARRSSASPPRPSRARPDPPTSGSSAVTPGTRTTTSRSSWTNPPPSGSPRAATHYRVRDPQGAAIGEGQLSRLSDGIGGLTVPKVPGIYSAEVWFEDNAGEQGPAATAPLRFDDIRPAPIEPEPVPTGSAVPPSRSASASATRPARRLSRASAATRSRSTRAPAGSPCAAADRCSDTETTLRGGIARRRTDDRRRCPRGPATCTRSRSPARG